MPDQDGPDEAETTVLLHSFATDVAGRVRALSGLSRKLTPLAAPGALDAPGAVVSALDALRRADLPGDLSGARDELVARLESTKEARRRSIRRAFLERFVPLFEKEGVSPKLRAENPLEYRIDPFCVVLDLASESARLNYCRIPVGEPIPLDAEAVLEASRSASRELAARSSDPARFAQALESAYRALLARRGRPPGERVELRDLYPEVGFALQPQRFLDDIDRRNLFGYSKVQFVHDLLRLRRERRLVVGDLRADLGVAHAGSAGSRRAFWLEDDSGQGMFYTTFRLVAAGLAPAPAPPASTAGEGEP